MSVSLLLAHGDDGFGLDQVLRQFAERIAADDRVEITPAGSPDEAAIGLLRLDDFGLRPGPLDPALRSELSLRRPPQQLHLGLQPVVELARAGEEGRPERRPGDGGAEQDEGDGGEPANGHGILLARGRIRGSPLGRRQVLSGR